MRGLAVVLAALVLAPSALAYGWPLKPFHRAHPIRGNFGDPRTVFREPFEPAGLYGAGAFSFHNGLDISAAPGQPVYPVVSGIARVRNMAAVSVRSWRGRTFKYMHITPNVYDGERVTAYKTVLGHVDGVAQHVHFSEIDRAIVVNPLGTHHLAPYRDRTKPRVASVLLLGTSGRELASRAVSGSVVIAVDVYDTPSLPVPGSWFGYPVAPAVVSWSLSSSSGRHVLTSRVVADFRQTIPGNRDFWRIYARGTYQNKPRFGTEQFRTRPGRYEFRLTRTALDTRRLVDGVYVVKVSAADTSGNRVSRSEAFTVCNANPASCTSNPR